MIHSSKQHSVQAFVQRVAAIKFKMTFSFIQTFHVFYGLLWKRYDFLRFAIIFIYILFTFARCPNFLGVGFLL